MSDENFCKSKIEKMLKRSQTKVIFPIITFGLLRDYLEKDKKLFSDLEIRACYESAVMDIKDYLKHDLHIGGKYYDAYPARNLPKYGVLKAIDYKQYELTPPYITNAKALIEWIPEKIRQHIIEKLGNIPELGDRALRAEFSEKKEKFLDVIKKHIDKNPSNFDSQRLNDGNVILIIDDVSKDIKNYLINMRVQSISKRDILKLAEQFEEAEDREKVLRIVYDEFRREYSSDIK